MTGPWIQAAAMIAALSASGAAQEVAGVASEPPRIQVAILLDVSGSMGGLIEQARAHLWRMVHAWVATEQDGAAPRVEVALYRYGMAEFGPAGHVERLLAFTDDLDRVSEALFALRVGGGEEYCGRAIRDALSDLAWSSRADDLRVILIAGNESFTQGPEDAIAACKDAIARGIMVNAFFCGCETAGVTLRWKEAAAHADGEFVAIDTSRAMPDVKAPQDAVILQLNERLNQTYIPFGPAGAKQAERQRAQDGNARQASRQAAIERTAFKASRGYQAREWDLIDALLNGVVKLKDIPPQHLPEHLRTMSLEEQKTYLKGKIEERQMVRRRLAEVTGDRRRFVEAQLTVMHGGAPALDQAVIHATRRQAAKRRFAAKDAEAAAPVAK